MSSIKCARHLRHAFNPRQRKRVIKDIVEQLAKPEWSEVECIVVCGVSGITIGSIVAHLCNKQLMVVRKEDEKRHSTIKVEGYRPGKYKYIIIDDLVASGNTLRHIKISLETISKKLECIGLILYATCEGSMDGEFITNLPDNFHLSLGWIPQLYITKWVGHRSTW